MRSVHHRCGDVGFIMVMLIHCVVDDVGRKLEGMWRECHRVVCELGGKILLIALGVRTWNEVRKLEVKDMRRVTVYGENSDLL